MTDEEATAALLALGSALNWEYNNPITESLKAQRDTKLYEVFPSPKSPGNFSACVFSFDRRYLLGGSQTEHPTRDAAKLACERHHATGEWKA